MNVVTFLPQDPNRLGDVRIDREENLKVFAQKAASYLDQLCADHNLCLKFLQRSHVFEKRSVV